MLHFVNDALILGMKYLEELSIFFSISAADSPFYPGGDHIKYLNYFNQYFPQKYIETDVANEPTETLFTNRFDLLLATIQANIKNASNLKVLALYSPPSVDEDLVHHLPASLKAFIIHSCPKVNFDQIPDVRLVSLKNCYLNDDNSHFVISSIQMYQEGHNQQLR